MSKEQEESSIPGSREFVAKKTILRSETARNVSTSNKFKTQAKLSDEKEHQEETGFEFMEQNVNKAALS